jgi:hypothetical protein
LIKIKATIGNNASKETLVDVRYMDDQNGVNYLKDTISNMVKDRMDPKSENFTKGVKWGVSFEEEEVTSTTVLEQITLETLKVLLQEE